MVNPIPEGFHSTTICLTVKNTVDAINFYKKAFDAQELFRMPGPDEKTTMHAQIKIGDSIIMLNDEFPKMGCLSPQSVGGASAGVYLYVPNVDVTVKKAADAGAKIKMPTTDMFWGDRMSSMEDPFGHQWTVATHTKDLTPDQIAKAAAESMKNMTSDCM